MEATLPDTSKTPARWNTAAVTGADEEEDIFNKESYDDDDDDDDDDDNDASNKNDNVNAADNIPASTGENNASSSSTTTNEPEALSSERPVSGRPDDCAATKRTDTAAPEAAPPSQPPVPECAPPVQKPAENAEQFETSDNRQNVEAQSPTTSQPLLHQDGLDGSSENQQEEGRVDISHGHLGRGRADGRRHMARVGPRFGRGGRRNKDPTEVPRGSQYFMHEIRQDPSTVCADLRVAAPGGGVTNKVSADAQRNKLSSTEPSSDNKPADEPVMGPFKAGDSTANNNSAEPNKATDVEASGLVAGTEQKNCAAAAHRGEEDDEDKRRDIKPRRFRADEISARDPRAPADITSSNRDFMHGHSPDAAGQVEQWTHEGYDQLLNGLPPPPSRSHYNGQRRFSRGRGRGRSWRGGPPRGRGGFAGDDRKAAGHEQGEGSSSEQHGQTLTGGPVAGERSRGQGGLRPRARGIRPHSRGVFRGRGESSLAPQIQGSAVS